MSFLKNFLTRLRDYVRTNRELWQMFDQYKKQLAEHKEVIAAFSELVDALNQALVDTNTRARLVSSDNVKNVACLILSAGGRVVVSRDLIDAVFNYEGVVEVNSEKTPEGDTALTLKMVPMEAITDEENIENAEFEVVAEVDVS